MRIQNLLAVLAIIIIVLISTAGHADAPRMINYQGHLADFLGEPLDTTVSITFTIYDDSISGNSKWTETNPTVTVTEGLFNVLLGSLNPIIDTVFADPDRWLEITVGGEIISPRTRLTSVPYSSRVSTIDGSTGGIIYGSLRVTEEAKGSKGPPYLDVGDQATSTPGRLEVFDGSGSAVVLLDGWSPANGRATIGPGQTNDGDFSFVTGAYNTISATGDYSTIAGGSNNVIDEIFSTISGGLLNEIHAPYASIGGGDSNYINTYSYHGTIAGGYMNETEAASAAIGGGEINNVLQDAKWGTIGGGYSNVVVDTGGTIAGGVENDASAIYASVGGGYDCNANGSYSAVSGGDRNTANGDWATISGGGPNTATQSYSTVGGGKDNDATNGGATIGGGENNDAMGEHATIAGGRQNIVQNFKWSTIGGGYLNTASDEGCTVAGGRNNESGAIYASVGGGYKNWASGYYSTIAGGDSNGVSDDSWSCTIGGGNGNFAGNANCIGATIAGGTFNKAMDWSTTVSGGSNNEALIMGSTIGGGTSNIAEGDASTIGGGNYNHASGPFSVIGGGYKNSTSGFYSAIPGGELDTITDNANHSMAFGNQVYLNSAYRVALFNSAHSGYLGVNRDDHDGGILFPVHVGTDPSNGNAAHLTTGGVWVAKSGKDFKEEFESLNAEELLSKIANMNIQRWRFKGSSEHHIGPISEDFVAAFNVGIIREDGTRDNKYLSAEDVAGVALAAVKELHNRNQALEDEVARLRVIVEQLLEERE